MSETPPNPARTALTAARNAAAARATVTAAAAEMRRALAAQRARIFELKAEIDEVSEAPFDAVEYGARVDARVAELAAYEPLQMLSLSGLVSEGPAHLTFEAELNKTLRLLAICNPTALASGLKALCAEHVQIFGPGISPAEKAARLATARTELAQLELEEASLIAEAAGAGLHFDRRPDASVAGVLGLEVE